MSIGWICKKLKCENIIWFLIGQFDLIIGLIKGLIKFYNLI